MSTTHLVVHPARGGLRGSVPVPSDKSISHRALILAALSSGRCELRGFSYGEDNVATLNAFRNMGLAIEDGGQGLVSVQGKGLDGLSAPETVIDCGNSGTTMRLLAGLLAGQHFVSRLSGDASLSRRPMGRIVMPLRARGAILNGAPHPSRPNELTPPLEVGPLPEGKRLSPLEYQLPISSAQVKSALLLSGLFASGPTTLGEPLVSRDHTERMMEALALPIRTMGSIVSLHPPADPLAIKPFSIDLPGDLSAAAFLLTAAAILPDSQITTRHTGLNPTRTGIVDVIRLLGGQLATSAQGETL
ncbi:MAG TPA: 3-phosphoshikimate 1-carboxyvinyltransferase, partial [Polyangiaceae bacterium]|nr:3-phosphoshikimate 1-carboxyvinyltransferase [Polyangiaceae bacterium]